MKIFCLLFFGLLFPFLSPAQEMPREAWITFSTSSYFPLLEVAIASVHAFSSRPIIAVGVNADIPFSEEKYPFLIKKRVDVDLKKQSIFYEKPRSILESGLDYGIYIEADDILLPGCDSLFDFAHTNFEYPLCPTHPHNPDNQRIIMDYLQIKEKSMPYVHGHVIFSSHCMPFIKEWYETCLSAPEASSFDETVLNVLLWKYKVTKQVFCYDPFFTASTDYFSSTRSERNKEPYCNWKMFHGCKYPPKAWEILEKLINK